MNFVGTARRATLQAQLALLYAAACAGLCVVVLAATNVLVEHGRMASGEQTPRLNLAGAAISIPIVIVAALVVGWVIAGRLLRPLRAITATARDISASDLQRRLNLAGPDNELTRLGNTLDDLFGRLAATFSAQRQFVSNAAHELRTPIAGQRTLLQVTLADPTADTDALRSACEEALQLGSQEERLIDALLTLATSEAVERWEPLDLADQARTILTDRHDDAARLGIAVDATLHPAPISGDPRLVASLIANLVDNAIRHNTPGGTMTLQTTAAGGRARIAVTNTGPVVAPDQLDRLMQPFQQGGAQRVRHGDGHGLGLAIVTAITNAHGGALTARARSEGGLDVEITFPNPAHPTEPRG